jgi:hypothetical protein
VELLKLSRHPYQPRRWQLEDGWREQWLTY